MTESAIALAIAIGAWVLLNVLVSALAISGGLTVPVTLALACVAGYLVYRKRSAAGA